MRALSLRHIRQARRRAASHERAVRELLRLMQAPPSILRSGGLHGYSEAEMDHMRRFPNQGPVCITPEWRQGTR